MMKRGRPPKMPPGTGAPDFAESKGSVDVDPDAPMPHEIDSAMDTLQKASEIQANPKMMAHVHEATGKKIMGLRSLRALANKKKLQGL